MKSESKTPFLNPLKPLSPSILKNASKRTAPMSGQHAKRIPNVFQLSRIARRNVALRTAAGNCVWLRRVTRLQSMLLSVEPIIIASVKKNPEFVPIQGTVSRRSVLTSFKLVKKIQNVFQRFKIVKNSVKGIQIVLILVFLRKEIKMLLT